MGLKMLTKIGYDTYDNYIDRALDKSKAGFFTSKAQQKDAIECVSRAFDILLEQKVYPKNSDIATKVKLMQDVPMSLYHVKEKHRSSFDAINVDTKKIFELKKMRDDFKDMEIVKVSKDNTYEKITKDIISSINQSGSDTGKSKKVIKDYFEGMNVRCSWHFARNSHGTVFIRVFWFLDGKFTKLSEILAIRSNLKGAK